MVSMREDDWPPKFDSMFAFVAFASSVRSQSRYVLTDPQREFLKTVIDSTFNRTSELSQQEVFWRAQIGHDVDSFTHDQSEEVFEAKLPLTAERMKPRRDGAREGRINAKGIPCLYCASEMDTAISEVRPRVGTYVSVARLVIRRPLNIVDCSINPPPLVHNDGLHERRLITWRVWSTINRAFSEPVMPTDDLADYAPTQVLAEAFRLNGFDGVMYGSLLGTGKTLALFDMDAVEVSERSLHVINSITFHSDSVAQDYY